MNDVKAIKLKKIFSFLEDLVGMILMFLVQHSLVVAWCQPALSLLHFVNYVCMRGEASCVKFLGLLHSLSSLKHLLFSGNGTL